MTELIAEPAEQSQRFAAFLSGAEGPLAFQDANGHEQLVDPRKLLRITRLNVTLDYFGPFGILAHKRREVGMVPDDLGSVPTIPAHELESIAEILNQPSLLLHYLHRRGEIEAANDVMASEGSLLAMYLATGFDLGTFEGEDSASLACDMDSALEPYFMGRELDCPVPKPKRRFTAWWNDILATLEARNSYGWMESAYGLLSLGYERQKEFEKEVKKMLKNVKSNWRDPDLQNVCAMVSGSPKRPVTVMCVGVKDVTIEEQRTIVWNASEAVNKHTPTSSIVAIVRSPSLKTYPYVAMYFRVNDPGSTFAPL